MIPQMKPDELTTVNQQINFLRNKLNSINAEIISFVEKRDTLNKKVQTIKEEITTLRIERDKLNEKVKTLKNERDKIRTNILPYIEDIKNHSQKIRDLKEKRSRENKNELKKHIDALEWQIATTTLDLQEEKKLIEKVKHLETQLIVHKKIDLHVQKIHEIKTQLNIEQEKAETFHKNLTETANKSQEIHSKMQLKFAEMSEIRNQATNLHTNYIVLKEQINPIHEELYNLVDKKRKIQETSRQEFEKIKKEKEHEIKTKIGSDARNKLQRGEKLSWHEFQLMVDDDKTEKED